MDLNNNDGERYGSEQMGSPIHSQVRKIKEESEKIVDWLPGKPERKPVLREISRQISRSPLGVSRRPISVGDQLSLVLVAELARKLWPRAKKGKKEKKRAEQNISGRFYRAYFVAFKNRGFLLFSSSSLPLFLCCIFRCFQSVNNTYF